MTIIQLLEYDIMQFGMYKGTFDLIGVPGIGRTWYIGQRPVYNKSRIGCMKMHEMDILLADRLGLTNDSENYLTINKVVGYPGKYL